MFSYGGIFMKHCAAHALSGLSKYKDVAPTILRIVVGFFFIMHGSMKLFGGIQGTTGFFASLGIPGIFVYLVAYGEFIGGIFLILGLLTRYVSIYLGVVMIFAAVLAKLPGGLMKGELELTYLAVLVALLFTGPGKCSLDSLCKCKKDKKKKQ